ncbi:hypothetical protein C8F04DRAFT_1182143 [Mycena alexandri]|uniref:NAD(P)-binding domain-containing protein n=1 Tax=Mycena alexandri TaxID=1745969 RepID=A0AAD6X4T7_9AGAR|nr:hypothetical protein C8F04DRAFT_1182143 [Mycena alexandri]
MSAIQSQTALIIGATGQVGGWVLKELLANPLFTRVGEYGRRTTALDGLPTGKDKLEQKKIDFEKIEEAGLRDGKWDVVFIALGTAVKEAGSKEAFERIDREYVINAARAAKSDHPQRLVYVSSVSADSNSHFLYLRAYSSNTPFRSKGLTEEGLAGLGYADTIVFRPAILGGRSDKRTQKKSQSEAQFHEFIFTWADYPVYRVFTGVLSLVSSSIEIKVTTLAKSLVQAGLLGSAALPSVAGAKQAGKDGAHFTLIGNAGALALATYQL